MKFDTYGKKKVVRVAYRSDSLQELFITKFKSQFKWSLTKVAVTRAGHSWEWSQGEFQLYYIVYKG